MRYDAPLSGAKITRMLNQLQFKLQVEEQYKLGIEKMAQAYKIEGDRRLKSETDSKRAESDGKIQLLRKALRRYETLGKFGGAQEEDDQLNDGQRKDALRKPLTGKLTIKLKSAMDLNHRPVARKSSKAYNESVVVIKIEGNERAVSHPSRNDKWHEEFEISIDQANEVEITIYDGPPGGDMAPVGMLWLRISDLVEALRRQKVGIESQGAGWVTAAAAASMGGRPGQGHMDSSLHNDAMVKGAGPGGLGSDGRAPEGIDGWFSVEPAGAISLHLDFGTFFVARDVS